MIRNEQTLRDPTRVIIPLKMFILTPWQHVDLAFTWRLFVQSLKYNFFPLIFLYIFKPSYFPFLGIHIWCYVCHLWGRFWRKKKMFNHIKNSKVYYLWLKLALNKTSCARLFSRRVFWNSWNGVIGLNRLNSVE